MGNSVQLVDVLDAVERKDYGNLELGSGEVDLDDSALT